MSEPARSPCCISATACFRSARSRTPTASKRRRPLARCVDGRPTLRGWMDALLDESLAHGRRPGGARMRWRGVRRRLARRSSRIDDEVDALRPSSAGARGDARDGHAAAEDVAAASATIARSRPGAREARARVRRCRSRSARSCAVGGIERARALEAFTVHAARGDRSAAMRLMPIGQIEAHALLAEALDARAGRRRRRDRAAGAAASRSRRCSTSRR